MNNKQRMISLLLTVIMVISVFTVIPAAVNAAEADLADTGVARQGFTGDCTWTQIDTELTISGSGAMEDYGDYDNNPAPWGTDITKLTIKKGVKSIGNCAFSGCSGLTSIDIPNSITSIGEFAFFACNSLKSITIPDSITSIGGNVFSGTPWEDSQPDGVLYVGKIAYKMIGKCPAKVVIKDGTKSIAPNAFACQNSLKSITIPDSVTSIGSGAFFACVNLKSITIPASVTSIGDHVFSDLTPFGFVFTIYGYAGSTAETYAKDNGIAFVALPSSPKISKVENVAGGVKITIGKVSGAAKYRYFRKTGSGKWQKLGDSAKTTYIDKTAKSGTKYAYTARCISKDGKKYTSDYNKTGKSITYIAAPKITKFENTSKGTKLTWSKSKGAVKFRVFWIYGGKWKKLADTTATSYVNTKVKEGTKFTYTVRCISKDGKKYTSGFDSTGKTYCFIKTPAAPTLKNTKAGVSISWKKSAGAAARGNP